MKEIILTSDDLSHIGLKQEEINKFFDCKTPDKKLKLLQKHRKDLLENIHTKEHQINTIDYFTYQISKSN